MKRNDLDDFSEKLDSAVTTASKNLTPEALSWIQEQCNEQMGAWFSDKIKEIKINFVVDSNIVIQSMIGYAKKNRQSILHKLAGNPVFSLYAPSKLEDEVVDYIENKRKESVDKIRLQEAWSVLRKRIITRDVKSRLFEESAAGVIGSRDEDDVPFVGVYLEMGAAGILTDDSHFDHPDIRKFSLSDLGDIVCTCHRGMLSFLVVDQLLPQALERIIDVLTVMTKILFDFFKAVFSAMKSLVTGAVSGLEKLLSSIPPAVAILLIGGSAAYLALNSKAREKILEKTGDVWNSLKPRMKEVMTRLKNLILDLFEKILALSPYLEVTSRQLFRDIKDFKEQIRSLNLEDAGHYS